MEKDLRKIVLGKLNAAINMEFIPVKSQLPGILARNKKAVKNAKNEKVKEQFKIMENYLEQVKYFEKLMSKMIKDINGNLQNDQK